MIDPIRKLSIRSRIYVGFFLVSCCVVLIAFIAVQGNRLTASGFDEYARINEKVNRILIIDNRVSSLQRRLQEYVYTGYEAVADQVLLELQGLETLLDRDRELLADGSDSGDYLARMHTHHGRYAETFRVAVEEIHNRNLYIEDIKRSLGEISASPDIPPAVKTRVSVIQKNVFQYLLDPDILLADASLEVLDREIAAATGSARIKLDLHKQHFIRVVQSTRGFPFLVTVVMAGEAQEFRYVSNALLDERGRTYVRFVAESSDRMHNLIHGLLEYSRIGSEPDRRPVDLNRVVDNVIQDLASVIESRAATVRIGSLPEISGNEMELTSLYTNLVSNALKFVVADSPPRVEIGCDGAAGQPVLFVRDNGIGIDPAQQDRIFKIFQRLQNRKDYAGNGIGLAHCRKIIESHQGNIWLESEPGKGSSFYFTIGRAA